MSVVNHFFIVGAGHFGRVISQEIQNNPTIGEIIAFLDDDPKKIGTKINQIPVYGPIANCVEIVNAHPSTEALVALPSASKEQLKIIHSTLLQAEFKRIRIIPSVSQFVTDEPHLVQVRDMEPQDLLGREPVLIDLEKSLAHIEGKRVLITGAGGSIGSELSRQLLYGGAKRLYLLGHGENSIYNIVHELNELQKAGVGKKSTIIPIIGEIQDSEYIKYLLDSLKADIIFHGAAHKHVPILELNPVEAVKNNVLGTKNLVQSALESGTERFVLISTDKAVNPSSVYGASKRISEMMVLSEARRTKGYTVVRFGNVLGSRGSIMPLFKKQILSGGPITVTDPETTRWFMTIPEAVSLILKTVELASKGGLYMLDMGKPVRILDFARQMIKFYGYDEDNIPIKFIGMRPGEKKTESLWSEEEAPHPTTHPRIIKIDISEDHDKNTGEIFNSIKPIICFDSDKKHVFRDQDTLKTILREFFPGIVE